MQEICVILLDVGTKMEACLEHAAKAVSNLLLSKVMHFFHLQIFYGSFKQALM